MSDLSTDRSGVHGNVNLLETKTNTFFPPENVSFQLKFVWDGDNVDYVCFCQISAIYMYTKMNTKDNTYVNIVYKNEKNKSMDKTYVNIVYKNKKKH